MLDIKKLTQEILENKLKRNFPINDLNHEFGLMKDEVKEAEEVLDNKTELAKELADIVIYAISIARIINIDLEKSIIDKVEYNKNRTHKKGTVTLSGVL